MMKTFPDIPGHSDEETISLINTDGFDLPLSEKDLISLAEIVQDLRSVRFRSVEVAYVDEDEIVHINKEFLDRDYVTDIISFRYDEHEDPSDGIEGTLFCCAPRISEQSGEFESDERSEFLRVAVHGLLHLTGLDDQTPDDKSEMTRLEDLCLETFGSGL